MDLQSSVTGIVSQHFLQWQPLEWGIMIWQLESGRYLVRRLGSLLGFLVFNVYPARVFMGDTGSLALGGFVAATALMLRLSLFIPIVALIYMIEVLSVMAQVLYFKMTKGKRLFKMAPIHHHFELSGCTRNKGCSNLCDHHGSLLPDRTGSDLVRRKK